MIFCLAVIPMISILLDMILVQFIGSIVFGILSQNYYNPEEKVHVQAVLTDLWKYFLPVLFGTVGAMLLVDNL